MQAGLCAYLGRVFFVHLCRPRMFHRIDLGGPVPHPCAPHIHGQIAIPNTVSQEWDPQEIVTFTHECDWDSTVTLSSACPNGNNITTVCDGIAGVRPPPGTRGRLPRM